MNGPSWFVILGTMRTGSNLLESLLARSLRLACLGELYNPGFIGRPGVTVAFGRDLAKRDRDPLGFLDAVLAAHPGRIPGFRLFDGHDPRVLARVLEDRGAAPILLTRDPLESFLSLAAAQATGQWRLTREEDRKSARLRFDPAAFARYEARVAAHCAALRAAFRAAGRSWFEIDYRDLSDRAAVDGAARYAGADAPLPDLPPPLLRQNPGGPAAMVENPEDLPDRGPAAQAPPPLLAARGLPVTLVLLPLVAEAASRALLSEMEAAKGLAARPPAGAATPAQLARRLARGDLLAAFVRHPAARAWAAFAAEGGEAPEAFDAFLDRAEDALAGRSAALPASIRPQAELLEAAAALAPPQLILRAEAGPGPLLARFGLEAEASLAGRFRRRLGRTPRLAPARLARIHALWRRDFAALGYPPPR